MENSYNKEDESCERADPNGITGGDISSYLEAMATANISFSWGVATFVFVVPVLLICILVFVRSKAPREAVTEPVKWPGFDIGNVLAPSYKYLAFAPNVTLYHQIMLSVSISTNLQLIGFKSEEEAVDFFTSRDTRVNKTIGVVVFDSPPTLSVVNYTIRLHSDNQWNTKFLFPLFLTVGPRSNDISASPPNYKDAFLPLQYAIDRAIVNLNCKVNDTFNRLKVTMKRMPFPPYINDGFIVIIQKELAVLLILGFIFPTLHSVRLVLVEKQRRMKLSENGPILRLSNPFLIFLLLMLYGISVSAFGFALSTFFNSAHTGVALVCTVLIIISLPYPILEEHYNELNLFTKLVACLLPSLAMGFTGLLIGRFESAGKVIVFIYYFFFKRKNNFYCFIALIISEARLFEIEFLC
ncbi:unnamed protein product [Trichobilharzia regenti]|nr:unnamed protein product [Trichobilharzia regenti]